MTRISKQPQASRLPVFRDHSYWGRVRRLLTGARLKEAGFNDLRLIEEAATLVGPGTGTVTRAPPHKKPTSTCRFAKNLLRPEE